MYHPASLSGIIIADKPKGCTSFDVVKKVRYHAGVKKVGHSGTLDPMATGVLALFLGAATKFVSHFMEGDKGYEGEMVLGIETDSLDADGSVVKRAPVSGEISKDLIEKALLSFTGEIKQLPPMVSAVHYGGRRLYELARRGEVVEREPRTVKIYELKLVDFVPGEFPRVRFYCSCSKGTYIRALVSDIGDLLKCGAHLSMLRRVYSHPFSIESAHGIEEIERLLQERQSDKILLSPEDFLKVGAPK